FLNCILIYRKFVNLIQIKYGSSGFIESSYAPEDVDCLKKDMEKVNPNLWNDSPFWRREILLLNEKY
ncbi:MAG: hypothetical protein LUH22_08970, partial [Bacteroides sp.]|nr:hypothetical protein [Bacteroides sp.]